MIKCNELQEKDYDDYTYLMNNKDCVIFKIINKNYDGTFECEIEYFYMTGAIVTATIKRFLFDDKQDESKYIIGEKYYLNKSELNINVYKEK